MPNTPYINKVLLTNPLEGWALSDRFGTTTGKAIVSSARNGTYGGSTVTLEQPGIGDGGFSAQFSGATPFLNIYSSSLASGFNGAECTIALWFKVSAAGVWSDATARDVISLQVNANNLFRLRKTTTTNAFNFQRIGGGTSKTVTAVIGPSTEWTFVAITVSESGNAMKAYVNGAQSGSTQTSLGTFAGSLAATLATIGASSTAGANPFSGWIGPAFIWTRALSASEIATLYTIPDVPRNQTRVRIFNRNGLAYEELDNVPVVRSWVLNGIGVAKFEIPKTDAKAREDVLQYGNPILIEHDRAGAWGGIITTPRPWTSTSIRVTAYDPGIYFKRRYLPTEKGPVGTPGDVMREMIRVMNAKEDTLIREGDDFFLGGRAKSQLPHNRMCWDAMGIIASRSQGEWEFIPDASSGQLIFKLNWYQQAGKYRNEKPLAEGYNIEYDEGEIMIEEGEIVNSARGYIKAVSGGNITAADAIEATSQSKFGLSEMIKSTPNGGDPQYIADGMVLNMAYPRRRWNITALDVDNTFDHLKLGDTIQLHMPGYGFTNQAVGSNQRVRIIAREFDDSTGKMPLTVYEVF